MTTLLPNNIINVNLSKDFAPGFLIPTGSTEINKPSKVLVSMLDDIDLDKTLVKGLFHLEENTYILDSVDKDLTFAQNQSCTGDAALFTYMLSRYYKENKIKKIAGKIVVSVDLGGGETFKNEFYNLTNLNAMNQSTPIITDNDVIHASVLWLNSLVKSMRSNNLAGMHPLSRTAVSENNIKAMVDYIKDSSILRSRGLSANPETVVKLFNTACCRKSHQFAGDTKFYLPELAAACLIVNVMTSPKASPGLITITNSVLKKIAKAAQVIDHQLIIDLMGFTAGGSAGIDAQNLYDAFKAKRAQQLAYPQQISIIVPQGFKAAEESTTKNFQAQTTTTKKK